MGSFIIKISFFGDCLDWSEILAACLVLLHFIRGKAKYPMDTERFLWCFCCAMYILCDTVFKTLIKMRNKKCVSNFFFFNLCCGDMWCTSNSVPGNLGYNSFALNDSSQWNDDLIIWILHLKGKGRKKKKGLPKASLPCEIFFIVVTWCLVLVWLLNLTAHGASGNSQFKVAKLFERLGEAETQTPPRDWGSARSCTSGLIKTTEMQFLGSDLVGCS